MNSPSSKPPDRQQQQKGNRSDSRTRSLHRVAVGAGDVASVEHWQVQAKMPSTNTELHTFTLRLEPPATGWQLESPFPGSSGSGPGLPECSAEAG